MNWLNKLLGDNSKVTKTETVLPIEIVEIQKALQSIKPEKAPYLACMALLAIRVAGADFDISLGEQKRICEILQKQFQLSKEEALAVTAIVSNQELGQNIEHYQITELLNNIATLDQKIDIIRSLFYVACEDDISEIESEKIRAISRALHIDNDQYIRIRSEFSSFRSILKKNTTLK
jgi:uncharacterized tellurite resistance protein B-like protein